MKNLHFILTISFLIFQILNFIDGTSQTNSMIGCYGNLILATIYSLKEIK